MLVTHSAEWSGSEYHFRLMWCVYFHKWSILISVYLIFRFICSTSTVIILSWLVLCSSLIFISFEFFFMLLFIVYFWRKYKIDGIACKSDAIFVAIWINGKDEAKYRPFASLDSTLDSWSIFSFFFLPIASILIAINFARTSHTKNHLIFIRLHIIIHCAYMW